jgi:integrase
MPKDHVSPACSRGRLASSSSKALFRFPEELEITGRIRRFPGPRSRRAAVSRSSASQRRRRTPPVADDVQRKCSARTLAEARKLKASKTTDVERGEFVDSRITFAEYAPAWIDGYKRRTKRGIKPETLADYRKTIERDALPFFGRMRLSHIRPLDIKEYAASIEKRGVAAGTVRLSLAPVKALLADALEEDLIRSNPTAGVRITTGEAPATSLDDDEDEEQAKALGEEELAAFLATLSADPLEKGWPAWRLFFEFLAHTGLRIGEAIALKWGDVDLGERQVRVRRRLYRGRLDRPKPVRRSAPRLHTQKRHKLGDHPVRFGTRANASARA